MTLLGVDAGNGPLLTGIILKGDEAKIAWDFGDPRHGPAGPAVPLLPVSSVGRSGSRTRDLIRRDGPERSGETETAHGGSASQLLSGERQHFHPAAGEGDAAAEFQKNILKIPADQPLMFRGHVDPRANACLV